MVSAAASKHKPAGELNFAVVPTPFKHPEEPGIVPPPPASVVVVYVPPEMVVSRKALLPASAMASFLLSAETATPCGLFSVAAEPTPSAKPALVPPALPPPTTVVSVAVLMVKRRMRLLPESAM